MRQGGTHFTFVIHDRGKGYMSGYLATGFGVIWLILGCYLYRLGRRQAALKRRLDRFDSTG